MIGQLVNDGLFWLELWERGDLRPQYSVVVAICKSKFAGMLDYGNIHLMNTPREKLDDLSKIQSNRYSLNIISHREVHIEGSINA